MTSRHGLRIPVTWLSIAVAALFRFSDRACSSNRTRSSSCFRRSISSACGAETAARSRPAESSARYTSSPEKVSWCAQRFRTSTSSLTKFRSARPRIEPNTGPQVLSMTTSSTAMSFSPSALAPPRRRSLRAARTSTFQRSAYWALSSRSTNGLRPSRRSSKVFPIRSWLVMAIVANSRITIC